jgi:hypothetical protein
VLEVKAHAHAHAYARFRDSGAIISSNHGPAPAPGARFPHAHGHRRPPQASAFALLCDVWQAFRRLRNVYVMNGPGSTPSILSTKMNPTTLSKIICTEPPGRLPWASALQCSRAPPTTGHLAPTTCSILLPCGLWQIHGCPTTRPLRTRPRSRGEALAREARRALRAPFRIGGPASDTRVQLRQWIPTHQVYLPAYARVRLH